MCTHVAVLDPGAVLLLRDLPVGGALQQAVGPLLLPLHGRDALAVQQLVALPQRQQSLAAPQLLRDLLQQQVPPGATGRRTTCEDQDVV